MDTEDLLKLLNAHHLKPPNLQKEEIGLSAKSQIVNAVPVICLSLTSVLSLLINRFSQPLFHPEIDIERVDDTDAFDDCP